MACGLPVVAHAVGALPELLGSDDRCGRLVPPHNPQALAKAIRSLLDVPGACEAVGARARERIVRTFPWRQAGSSLLRVFGSRRARATRRA